MKGFRTLALALGALAIGAAPAFAFPDRPVQLIVPWAAGGGMDSVMRIFANGLEAELKQPVNVINRTGGGGITGHSAIATAAPDGYTIGGASPEISFFKALGLGDLTPDSIDMFSRVSLIPAGITVKADSPWKNRGRLSQGGEGQPQRLDHGLGHRGRRLLAHRLWRHPEGGRHRP